jgi:hypothetical protein
MRIYTPSDGETPDLASYRDRTGTIAVDNLRVQVKITDARMRFGHLDLLVTPIAGEGERWIEQHRIELTI